MSMPVLSARGLRKSYGPQTLLEGATITLRQGEKVGLLGVNGTGKSTLLRVLAGLEPVDEGVIDRARDASILYLSQEPELEEDATPRQIVEGGLAAWSAATRRYAEVAQLIEKGASSAELLAEQAELAESVERLGGWTRGHIVDEMLAKLGVLEKDRPVRSMSGGERRRVALARTLVAAPHLAILDEPTNHLDTETIEWLEGYLADTFAGAVFLVTHDRYVLDAICDRVFELDRGILTEFIGNYSDYLDQKADMLAHEARVESNRLNLLRRERAWLARGPKARSTKQKARIKRAESVIAAGPLDTGPARVRLEGAPAARLGKTILDLEDVRLAIGDRTLVDKLTLHLVSGERIGVVGKNGVGKTTLLRVASGDLEAAGGKVVRGVNTRVAYFDQARAALIDDWSIFDNVAGREGAERTGGGMVDVGGRAIELRAYLEQFLFEGSKIRQKVGSLSGGERARVALAKTLRSGANLLLLDEPTNDLDVATLGALEEMLATWDGCAIVVSHDRAFLERVATGILAFEGDGRAVLYQGSYNAYRSLKAENEEEAKVVAAPAPRPAAQPAEPEIKPLTYAERIELEGIMEQIDKAEGAVRAAEARLADPAVYSSTVDGRKAQTDLEAAHAEVARLTARWESLEERGASKRS